MRYTITYGRKVRTRAYEILEITLYMEFDERTDLDEAFAKVRDKVEEWIEKERYRIMKQYVSTMEEDEDEGDEE